MNETLTLTNEQMSQQAAEQFQNDVLVVGGRSHEVWQEGWRAEHTLSDGSVEPRIKPTTDEEWISSHGGTTEVDIAHTDFADLPKDRQAESMASAVIAVEDVYRDAFYNDYIEIYRTEGEAALRQFATSDKIHDGWLERNSSWATDEQKLPFAQLSKAEQDKDIDFHIGALESVIGRLKDRSFEVPDELLLKWLSQDAQILSQTDSYDGVISDINPTSGGFLHIKVESPDTYTSLDGEYPMATIALHLNGELQTAKEQTEDRQRASSLKIGALAAGGAELPHIKTE